MRQPHELMSKNYSGPSTVIPLGDIRNIDGFRFIGIDCDGGEHYCIVREDDSGSYYMGSNTATFQELIGWIPDMSSNTITFKEMLVQISFSFCVFLFAFWVLHFCFLH